MFSILVEDTIFSTIFMQSPRTSTHNSMHSRLICTVELKQMQHSFWLILSISTNDSLLWGNLALEERSLSLVLFVPPLTGSFPLASAFSNFSSALRTFSSSLRGVSSALNLVFLALSSAFCFAPLLFFS